MLEIISPAGFEHYFREIEPLLRDGAAPHLEALAQVTEKYGLQMDSGSLPGLIERFHLLRSRNTDGNG